MTKRLNLKSGKWLSDTDLARQVIDALKSSKVYAPSNLYRGMACPETLAKSIVASGTDKQNNEAELCAVGEDTLYLDLDEDIELAESRQKRRESREYPGKDVIFCHEEGRLEESIRYAIRDADSTDMPRILVYDSTKMAKSDWPYSYEFTSNPKKALRALVTLR